MKAKPILVVEDEHAVAAALATVCRRLGHETRLCYSGRRGLEELAQAEFALVILDIGLPDVSGLTLLEQMQRTAPRLPVLIITAHGNLQNAVAARQLGASAYLVKPLDLATLQDTIQQLVAAPPAPATPPAGPPSPDDTTGVLIGAAPAMQRVFVEIAQACATGAPILITGPTGTGKTLVGRVIHTNSARRTGPFVALHCSALPEQLLESELFGHEKHAFTGAAATKSGHLERAAGGTLFLDEIGDLSLAVQAKLLRFVEDRVFTRVGGRTEIRVDLRLITATNKDLPAEVRAGRFREDLYYRLRVLEIEMPALGQRTEDIPSLAAFFLGGIAAAHPRRLSPEALEMLARYPWPGNVRELRNALEHAVAVAAGPVILPQHLPREIRLHCQQQATAETAALDRVLEAWLAAKLRSGATYDDIVQELESAVLHHLLRHFNGRPTLLARVLKMNRATLLKKRKLMGLIP